MMNGKQKHVSSHIENEDVIAMKKSKIDDNGEAFSTSSVPSEEKEKKNFKVNKINASVVVPSEEKENEKLKVYPKRNRLPSAKAIACLSSVPSKSNSNLVPKGSERSPNEVQVRPATTTNEKPADVIDIIEPSVVPLQSASEIKLNAEVDTEVVAELPSFESTPKEKKTVKTKKATSKPTKINATNDEGKRKRCMPKTVEKRLQQMGIIPSRVSSCVKAAMSKGYIKLTGDPSDLEQFIIEGDHWDHHYKVLLKDVLYQADYGGDYEDGSENASACCSCCAADDYPGKAYVTRLCTGNPELDSGKFHNHCTECKKGFGVCIGDYRMAHCDKCNKHWFTGMSGFPCDNCKSIKQQSRGYGGLFMNVDGSDSDDEDYRQGTCTLS